MMTSNKEMMERVKLEQCPICGWVDVQGDEIDVDHSVGMASQECYCEKCDSAWVETYTLAAVRVLKNGENA